MGKHKCQVKVNRGANCKYKKTFQSDKTSDNDNDKTSSGDRWFWSPLLFKAVLKLHRPVEVGIILFYLELELKS